MGRKSFTILSGVLLAGLAATGCQQSSADKALQKPWANTPRQVAPLQSKNTQTLPGQQGVMPASQQYMQQGTMTPGSTSQTRQSLPYSNSSSGMMTNQTNTQRMTTPQFQTSTSQPSLQPYPSAPTTNTNFQQSNASFDSDMPTPAAPIEPTPNPFRSTPTTSTNHGMIPGPQALPGSSTSSQFGTPSGDLNMDGGPALPPAAPPVPPPSGGW